MKTQSLPLYVIATVFICCGCSPEQHSASRDHLILSAVVSHFASRSDTEWSSLKGAILIDQTTDVEYGSRIPDEYLRQNEFLKNQVDVALIKDFMSRNSTSVSVVGLKTTPQFRVVSDTERELVASGKPPSDAKMGITLYLPGVSADGQSAYARIALPGRHGSHAHYVLAKRFGQWKVRESSVVIHSM